MSKWISVRDKLPDEDKEVIVCVEMAFGKQKVISDVYDGIYWVHSERFLSRRVSHWMPMPEPPKPKER